MTLSFRLKCINTSNNDVVATWRATPLTTMKKGVLSISSDYVTECEPIIITGIAIEGSYPFL